MSIGGHWGSEALSNIPSFTKFGSGSTGIRTLVWLTPKPVFLRAPCTYPDALGSLHNIASLVQTPPCDALAERSQNRTCWRVRCESFALMPVNLEHDRNFYLGVLSPLSVMVLWGSKRGHLLKSSYERTGGEFLQSWGGTADTTVVTPTN